MKIRRTRLMNRGTEPLTQRNRQVTLVVLATEDTHAAKQYFDALEARGLVNRGRVKVVSLPTQNGHSTLNALLDRLDAYRQALDVKLSEDAYWAIFDVDRQTNGRNMKALAQAVQVAKSRGNRLAGSNPCFELWLLLHLTDDLSGIPAGPKDRGAADKVVGRLQTALENAFPPEAQGYNKTNIRAERFVTDERVKDACARAKERMSANPGPWPEQVGTHVHALVEDVLQTASAL